MNVDWSWLGAWPVLFPLVFPLLKFGAVLFWFPVLGAVLGVEGAVLGVDGAVLGVDGAVLGVAGAVPAARTNIVATITTKITVPVIKINFFIVNPYHQLVLCQSGVHLITPWNQVVLQNRKSQVLHFSASSMTHPCTLRQFSGWSWFISLGLKSALQRLDMSTAYERALITGASSGIGLALAREFARQGHPLVITATDQKKLRTIANAMQQEFNVEVTPIAKDLTEPIAAHQLFSELNDAAMDIHILVNDAGIGQHGKFFETPLDREIAIVRLNVEAVVRLTKIFLKPMVLRNAGRILNVASVAGFDPGPLLAVYHASKAFVLSFSQALAIELEETEVTVTALCPGATETAFFEKADMNGTRVVNKLKLASPHDVAVAGYKAMRRGDPVYVHGGLNKAKVALGRLLPGTTQSRINKRYYEPVRVEERKTNLRSRKGSQATLSSRSRFHDAQEVPRSARRHTNGDQIAEDDRSENS